MPGWLWNLIAALAGRSKPSPPGPPTPPTPPSAGDVLSLVNAERTARRLAPLALNVCLAGQATAWAEAMRQRGRISHDGFADRLAACGLSGGGECVAEGQTTASAAVQAWMQSPGHRAILLGNYRTLGAGNAGAY